MTVWFTSDQHFGHENIIKLCNRPFETVEEMDAVMIERWNSVVKSTDTVYHLGDFTLQNRKGAREYFRQLNGIVYMLSNPWHHDKRWLPKSGDFVPGCGTKNGVGIGLRPPIWVLEFPELGDGCHPQIVVLCHYPLAVWDRKHHGAWHLFGHSHGQYMVGGLSLDVGVDDFDFQPVHLDNVAHIMEGLQELRS